ncbi:hypothetical protein NRP21_27175 [Roseomonas pecuniae]|uniref:Uncharacterized protein n=1 Tax=Roseomonas populi TaxID=3121582 RepID=A0ABT1XC79_9PROT|nr:hypothetical protein [Roseomonas pecuniae]MCR0985740.1 hypothetical protein [Roseomonas pecuniae]
MSTPGNPIEAGCDKDGSELAAAGQGCLEPGAAVILTGGNVLVLGDEEPALALDEGPDAGLLRFEPQPGVALLGG